MASERPVCIHSTNCYRRNPEHFRQVDHPHLDDLLIGNIEDMPISVPVNLNFACNNRQLLKEQLEILRRVKRERYVIVGETSKKPTKSTTGHAAASSSQKVDLTADVPTVDLTENSPPPKPASNSNERPSQVKVLEIMRACGTAPRYVPKAGNFLAKYKLASPYNIFFTAVQKTKETWGQRLSVTFSELLDKSLGEIVSSFHFSFVVNIGWLCTQYLLAEQKADMLVFCQCRDDEDPLPPSIKIQEVKSPYEYGSHHTKMSILHYKDNGIRIIVSTANLYDDDYNLRTQSLWMSPHLPRLPETARDDEGESKTGFKANISKYFAHYKQDMGNWRSIISRADFSSVNVAFVASVPGLYRSITDSSQWGHKKLATILANHAEVPEGETNIVATASSIGNLGPSYNSWLTTDIVNSMSKATNQPGKPMPKFKLMYPTIENYKRSYDLMECSNCLSYHELTHAKQNWIKNHLYQWKASCSYRTEAMPHIKMYVRLSADERKAAWMLVGSANVSKAAWGYMDRGNYKILSYEVGIVLLPKFVTGGTYFPVGKTEATQSQAATPMLPIPYNLPLTPYSETDEPYLLLAS